MISKDQYKVLADKIDQLQLSADIQSRDMSKDRQDLQEFAIRLGAVENELKELRKGQKGIVDRVGDKIAENVAPIIESADNLKESIDEATIIKVREKKINWWDKLIKGVRLT